MNQSCTDAHTTATQRMTYGDDFFSDPANEHFLEIEAKNKLLTIGANEGWSTAEMQQIRKEKTAHEKEMKKRR